MPNSTNSSDPSPTRAGLRVYLTTAYAQGVALRYLKEGAARDRFGVHRVVDSPGEADVFVFVENGELDDIFYTKLAAHPLVVAAPDRVYMYNEWDFPYCVLPGLYTSMPRRSFAADRQAACGYLFQPNEFVTRIAAGNVERDLLYSFAGAPNHRVRRKVFDLVDPRAHVEDTRAFSIWSKHDPAEVLERKRSFASVMARSKFILCPRGAGTSSFRLFETLEAGRVPVVIGDEWVRPAGPDWGFLVQVAERDVASIPDVLRGLESEAIDRGRAARAAWESFYAPDVVFHRMIDLIADLHARRTPRAAAWLPDREYLRLRTEISLLKAARACRDRVKSLLSPGR